MPQIPPDINMVEPRYRPLILQLLAEAREHLQSGQALRSTYYIGSTQDSVLERIVMDTSSAKAKEAAADHARRLATFLDADFVVMLTEAWGVPESELLGYDKIIARYGSLAAYPKHLDIVFLQLETRHGYFSASAPIRAMPPSKKRRQFGQVTWMKADGADGRLAGILPKLPSAT